MDASCRLLVFSLLLLPFLLHSKSQGIGLDKGFSRDMQNLMKRSDSGGCDDEEANLCNQVPKHISTPGKMAKNRKLLVSTSISSSHIKSLQKEKMIESNTNNAKGDLVAATSLKQHEELVAMAEMDYTAATRKPPIHN